MWLLVLALFGATVPNGMFLYSVTHDYPTLLDALRDRQALSLLIDAFLATGVLAWLFAKRPLGPVRWPWFVAMSLLGGLGFSVPFYVWLNQRLPARE